MRIAIVLLIVAAFLFTACQKQLGIEGLTPAPPVKDDSTLLSVYIELDTTSSAPYDTLSKTFFYYDNAKRNTGIDLIYYINGAASNYQYKSRFIYNGSDTMPAKKTVNSLLLPDTDPNYYNDVCNYTYSNGRLIYDSTVFTSSTSVPRLAFVNKYTYSAGRIRNDISYYFFSTSAIDKSTEYIYPEVNNGNIVKQADTTSLGLTREHSFEYDNHPNPFKQTQSKIAIDNRYPYYHMETYNTASFSTNNLIEVKQLQGYPDFHFKYQYIYKENGYPSSVYFVDVNYPIYFAKGVFIYTK